MFLSLGIQRRKTGVGGALHIVDNTQNGLTPGGDADPLSFGSSFAGRALMKQ